jgi:hypothetical protein
MPANVAGSLRARDRHCSSARTSPRRSNGGLTSLRPFSVGVAESRAGLIEAKKGQRQNAAGRNHDDAIRQQGTLRD